MRSLGFKLYLIFTISWFLHMTARIEPLGTIRFDMLLAGTLILLMFFSGGRAVKVQSEGTGKILKILFVYAVVTVPLVEWPGSVLQNGLFKFFQAALFYFFTVTFVSTEKRLKVFMVVFLACQTFRVLEPLYLNITQDYWGSRASLSSWEMMNRLAGSPYDVVNPNGLAFVILTVIPFIHYLSPLSFRWRLVYWGALPPLLYALVLTSSRTGMVGLAAIYGVVWLRSRHKVALTALMLVGVVAMIPRMSADQIDRYLSIFSDDTKNAATAEDRMEGMKEWTSVALRRPLFGHGLGTSLEANANYGSYGRIAHNLYLEIAQELGFIGLFIFLFYIKHALVNFRRARSEIPEESQRFLHLLVLGMQTWMFMNILFSFASFGLSNYEWYLFGGLSVVLRSLAAEKAALLRQNEPRPVEVPMDRLVVTHA